MQLAVSVHRTEDGAGSPEDASATCGGRVSLPLSLGGRPSGEQVKRADNPAAEEATTTSNDLRPAASSPSASQ